jgi:phosphate uptake regulator
MSAFGSAHWGRNWGDGGSADEIIEVAEQDAVSVTDQLLALDVEINDLDEAFEMEDEVLTEIQTFLVQADDTISVSDELSTATDYTRPVDDAVSTADTVTAISAFVFDREVQDSVDVTDQTTVETFTNSIEVITALDAVDIVDVVAFVTGGTTSVVILEDQLVVFRSDYMRRDRSVAGSSTLTTTFTETILTYYEAAE